MYFVDDRHREACIREIPVEKGEERLRDIAAQDGEDYAWAGELFWVGALHFKDGNILN